MDTCTVYFAVRLIRARGNRWIGCLKSHKIQLKSRETSDGNATSTTERRLASQLSLGLQLTLIDRHLTFEASSIPVRSIGRWPVDREKGHHSVIVRLWGFIMTWQQTAYINKEVKRGENGSKGCTLLPRWFGTLAGSWLAMTWHTSNVASGTTTECCTVTIWLHW